MQRETWVYYGRSSPRELRQDGAESEGDRDGSSIHLAKLEGRETYETTQKMM